MNVRPHICLLRPQIPQNTGNISRLCVGLSARLVIVGKASFDLGAPAARRAGLDHWSDLDLVEVSGFRQFKEHFNEQRVVAITKEGKDSLFDFQFYPGDLLFFGNETSGLPPQAIKRADATLRIPMWGKARSLNLANAVSVVAYQYIEAMIAQGNWPLPETRFERTYFKRS